MALLPPLLAALALPLLAQSATGSLLGRVVEASSGNPRSGFLVRVTQEQLGIERVAVTDAGGGFRVLLLPPETYTVQVVQPGHFSLPRQVTIGTDQPVRLVLWVRERAS